MSLDYRHDHRFNQNFLPALAILTENVSPSCLHIFLGVVTDIFKQLEIIAKQIDLSIYENIQEILSKYRIEKQAWYMCLTGEL
jgi:hypothetical protein